MEIKCDIAKTKEIVKNMELNIERYNEVVKNMYDISENFAAFGWTGVASKNYSKYLTDKKSDFDQVYAVLKSFSKACHENICSLENAVANSKVSSDD